MNSKQITENLPYKVKNIELADSGRDALSISEKEMPGLMVTRSKYGPDKPLKGKKVKVHYKGMLLDGTVFDSSFKRNQPIEFTLGIGQVIKGWDEGISLLGVGDKASFIIPSDLAYGESGAGGVIPPNAPLLFEVELISAG